MDSRTLSKVDYLGNSRKAPIFRIALESFRIRMIIWWRYRAEVVGNLIEIAILIGFFFLFATAVGFRGLTGFGTNEIFIFFLSGLMIMLFDSIAIWTPLRTINRDLYNGTLEYLYFSPHRKFPYYLGFLIGAIAVEIIISFIPLFSVLIIASEMPLQNIIMSLVVISVLLSSLLSFGIIIGLSVILWKQVQNLASLIGLAMQFLTGGLIPLVSIPEFLRYFGYIFPQTWAYELIHYYTFNEKWPLIVPLEISWFLLLGFSVFYTILAFILHKLVIKHSKREGLHLL